MPLGPGPSRSDMPPSGTAGESLVETAEDPLLAGLEHPLTVLVVGAGGFVGRHLVERLASRGHRVRAAGREGRPRDVPFLRGVTWLAADITSEKEVRGLAGDCDAVVHLAGIRRESPGRTFDDVHVRGTRHLLDEAGRAGVERFIFVSTLGATASADAFGRSKAEAERAIRRSAVEGVILRPAVIVGPGDHFTGAVLRWLERFRLLPVPAAWDRVVRPVAIEDVADALCQCVERPDVAGRTLTLAGPERLALSEAARTVAAVAGRPRAVVRVPGPLGGPVTGLVRWLSDRAGLPPDEWEVLRRIGRAPDPRKGAEAFREVFHIEPMPFRAVLEDYL